MQLGGLVSIERLLRNLDADESRSVLVWRMPAGVTLGDVKDPRQESDEYLQSAGSSDRMSLEIRKEVGGTSVLYAVGRSGEEHAIWQDLKWGSHTLKLRSNEIFSADEALPIYEQYIRKGQLPKELALRRIST
jgi:hypothetical protein